MAPICHYCKKQMKYMTILEYIQKNNIKNSYFNAENYL